MTPQEHLYCVLKKELNPKLRAVGFKGSRQNFTRVTGEIIHAINIQGSKYGDSCILNLGIHMTFLPDTLGKMRDARRVREINCEFRSRLRSPIHTDGWWSYGDDIVSSEASAHSLIQTYFREGETHFAHYNSTPAILTALACLATGRPQPHPPLGDISPTQVRAAYAAARIYRHRGEIAESRRFAEIALSRLGQATSLRAELESLARQPQP